MSILTALAIVFLAALVHATFQLSVSMLTLLSGHSIGSKKSQQRTFTLTSAFTIGAGIATVLLLGFIALVFLIITPALDRELIWMVLCGLLIGVGIAVWLFYYRKERGTSLWLPRSFASFLSERGKKTKHSAEAFSLGVTSVLSEILFIIAPLSIAGFALIHLPDVWQLAAILLYTILSLSSLVAVWMLVGSGYKLSRIQKWRETNKHFLQFVAAAGLIILGFFVYVEQVLTSAAGTI